MRLRRHTGQKGLPTMLFMLLISLMMVSGGVYAWHIIMQNVLSLGFITGSLEPNIAVEFWDKDRLDANKWTSYKNAENDVFYCYLGEILDITQLPADCNSFLKIKVSESSSVDDYIYDVTLFDIAIELYDYETGLALNAEINALLDYFHATLTQKCFDISYFIGEDGLNPSTLTYSERWQIDSVGQSLSGGNFSRSDQWLYIKIDPRLQELQNIFKTIPASYMPYILQFVFKIDGVTRSID